MTEGVCSHRSPLTKSRCCAGRGRGRAQSTAPAGLSEPAGLHDEQIGHPVYEHRSVIPALRRQMQFMLTLRLFSLLALIEMIDQIDPALGQRLFGNPVVVGAQGL